MKLIIDRNKWRCGGDGVATKGKGFTALLNKEGYMCCLGFYSLAVGYSEQEILYNEKPSDCVDDSKKLLYPNWCLMPTYQRKHYTESVDIDELMMLNDDPSLDQEERECLIKDTFSEHGVEVEFVGEFNER